MSYLVLARKHRPQTFEEVIGQGHVTQTLKNAIRSDRVAHALVFAGPRGVGKTSVARIMAKAMNCVEGPTIAPCNVCSSCEEITTGMALDVFEIDGASNRGINEIRELRESIKYMPNRGRFKIYIIDEVHMLTTEAFNALLKTLEEPPSHVLFFFATTESHKIPATILSRCQRHNFKRITLEHIVAYLEKVAEKLSFHISKESLQLLAHEAGGSMRDALSLLDQIMAYSEDTIEHAELLDALGAVDRNVLFDLCGALVGGDVVSALNLLDNMYRQGYDLKRLYGQILEHLRHLLIVKLNDTGQNLVEVPANEIAQLKTQAKGLSLESIHQIFTLAFESETSIRFSDQPKLVLEALFISLFQLKNLTSLDKIITGIDGIAKTLTKPIDSPNPKQEDIPVSLSPKQLGTSGQQADDVSINAEDLDQTWRQLLPLLESKCTALVPALERAFLSEVGKDSIEITVSGNSFFAARLRDEKNLVKIRDVCSQFFGRNMGVRIAERQIQNSSLEKRSKETDKTKRLKKEALSHPTVTDTLEVFQGTVVDIKII